METTHSYYTNVTMKCLQMYETDLRSGKNHGSIHTSILHTLHKGMLHPKMKILS